MKKTILLFITILSFGILASCSNPTNTSQNQNTNNTQSNNNDTNNNSSENNNNNSNEQNQTNVKILQILPQTHKSIEVNTMTTISYITGSDFEYWKTVGNINNNFGFEFAENGNPNNISFDITPTVSNGIYVIADKPGTVTFRIWNKTTETLYSNYITLEFVKTVQATDSRFIGKWITNDTYLIDTIEFYSNGTMKHYNSSYPDSSTQFNWEVKTANSIYISGNSNCTANFIFTEDLQTLRLINYFGYDKILNFTKQ